MASNDCQEPLQPFSPSFNNLFRETVGEDFPRKGWNVYSRRFTLENITECFKIRITATNRRVAKLECRDICLQERLEFNLMLETVEKRGTNLADDLIVGVHLATKT